jgi:hypothetical protein
MASNERLCFTVNQKVMRRFVTICALRGINRSHIVENLLVKWIEENTTPDFLVALDKAEKNSPSIK